MVSVPLVGGSDMKISVLNGSPKGITSVTMQYVHYIQKKFPCHELRIINISPGIHKIENDAHHFQEIMDDIRSSQGVLWAFPVYFLLVPSNYKRFIELISINRSENIFKNKYAAVLTTSIHFFDHTAHNYMNSICDDLDMKYTGYFSADMYDLRKQAERERLELFAGNFFDRIEHNTVTSKRYTPLVWREFNYVPGQVNTKVEAGDKKVLMVTDCEGHQENLAGMIERFRNSFSDNIEVINLHGLDIKGSCIGCIQCGYDNRCRYEGKDDYIDFFNSKIKRADILVWAGAISDRYLSSRWKLFFDRSFFNNHVPSLTGKQLGFIISGPLSQVPNLSQILESYAELQMANHAGFITDEFGDSAEIDSQIQEFASRLVWFAEKKYIKTPTFLSVGGGKIFRDAVWGRLRFPFRADHVAYKRLGLYDFPQKRYKKILKNKIMLFLSKSPAFRKEVNKRMIAKTIEPLQEVVEN